MPSRCVLSYRGNFNFIFLSFSPLWWLSSGLKCRVVWLNFTNVSEVLADSIIRTSEMLVNFYQTTWRYNPEDSHLSTHCRENLKSYSHNFIDWVIVLSLQTGQFNACTRLKIVFPATPWSFSYSSTHRFIIPCYFRNLSSPILSE
jgi:hypothetical protein